MHTSVRQKHQKRCLGLFSGPKPNFQHPQGGYLYAKIFYFQKPLNLLYGAPIDRFIHFLDTYRSLHTLSAEKRPILKSTSESNVYGVWMWTFVVVKSGCQKNLKFSQDVY